MGAQDIIMAPLRPVMAVFKKIILQKLLVSLLKI
jgi:hypothetical protein